MFRFLALTIILSCIAFSQGKKYEFAKSYLDNGKYEDAARLFKELYEEDSNNPLYLDGLISSYYSSNKFSELLSFLETNEKANTDPGLIALMGDLYYKNNFPNKSKEKWDYLLRNYQRNVNIYEVVANYQRQNRLLEDALKTYKTFRLNSGDENIFSDDIIKLYIAVGDFKNGTEETIKVLLNNRNQATAQGRIYALMSAKGATEFIKGYLDSKSRQYSSNFDIQELVAWFYNTIGDYERAFEVNIKLDELRRANGSTIYSFARNSARDGNYDVAIKAYSYIIDNKNKYKKFFKNSLLSYAEALENKMKKDEQVEEKTIKEIVKRYEDIIDDDQKSNLAQESLYRLGLLYKDFYKDYDKSRKYFEKIIKGFGKSKRSADALILMGDIEVLRGDLDAAIENYETVLNSYPRNMKFHFNTANYKIGLCSYYNGDIKAAKTKLSSLIQDQNSETTNDALELYYLLLDNKDFETALGELGNADYLKVKAKDSSDISFAEKAYDKIITNYRYTPIAEEAYLGKIELFQKDDLYKTIKIADEFMYEYPTSILADEILIIKAESYEKLDNTEEAQRVYSQILVEYPNSIYLQKARDSIRRLRGEI